MSNPSRAFEFLRLWPGLPADPSSGLTGEFYYNSTTSSLRYYDGTGWTDFGGVWADQQLSNLIGPTSISVDLLPSLPLISNIGSSALPWARADIYNLSSVNSVNGSYGNGLIVDTSATTGTDPSGGLNLITGSTVGGNSGSILIQTGLPAGGTTVFLQQNTSFASAAFNFSSFTFGVQLAGIQIVAASNASLSGITFKLQNATGTADTFLTQVFVYADNAGQPGALITSSPSVPISLAGSATQNQLYTFNVPAGIISSNTYYFILAAAGSVSTLNMLGSSTSIGATNFTSSTNSGGTWTTTAAPDPYFIIYTAPLRGTVDVNTSAVRLLTQAPLRFYDNTSSHYVGFVAASSISTNTTWTLPIADGTAGYALTTNGSGQLGWSSISSGLYVLKSGDTMTGALNLPSINVNSNQFRWINAQTMGLAGVLNITDQPSTAYPGYLNFTHGAHTVYIGVDDTGLLNVSPGNFLIGGGTSEVFFYVNSAEKFRVGTSANTTSQAIVPASAGAIDHGSNALYFRDVYASSVTRQAQILVGNGGTSLPSGTSGAYGLNDLNIGNLGTMAIWSQSNNAATANPTGTIRIETGNKTAGTGNSGDIYIQTGTSSGGTRGSIYHVDGSQGTAGMVWTSVGTQGKGTWASVTAPAGVTPNVQYITVSAPQAVAKAVTLSAAPTVPSKTLVDMLQGDAQIYGVDYTVSGTTLSWSGLGLDGVLTTGDILRIVYWT
jgi:hypothetical protein